jgi:hypothetical protein
VTLHGRDAVVIVSAETWDREHQHRGSRLVEMLAGSPLGELDLEREVMTGTVRDVEL